jgi:Protein of unknown function (DUF3455)
MGGGIPISQHDDGVKRQHGMKGAPHMNHLRAYGSIILAALLLVVGQALLVPASVSAHRGTPPSTVPSPFTVPAGNVLLFYSHAKGVQTSECVNGQWAFRAPSAVLFKPHSHRPTAIHYGGIDRGLTAGPWWQSLRDGSRIRAGNPVSAPSPHANSIPLLQLQVLEWHGKGAFSKVNYIQRLNTVGGVGPTGACQAGARRSVPYTADYYFYGSR